MNFEKAFCAVGLTQKGPKGMVMFRTKFSEQGGRDVASVLFVFAGMRTHR